MTLLCYIPGCRVLHVTRAESTALRIAAQAKRDHACCPGCRTVSRSVHSRYHRRPADLPTSGQAVRLTLTIRRFYCPDPACARRTFAERLPRLLDRYAQRTRRLADARVRTALALGVMPAARLLPHLAMPTRATTLLRDIRKWPLPTRSKPIIVGVDDGALRKGRTYGTILVDLERRRPIDLLPDRSAATPAARLRRDPQIQVVARDRSTEYARGTTMGAPDAVQVADRWHLLLKTRQMVERWLARVHPRLKLLPAVAPSSPSIRRVTAFPRAPSEMLARAAARGRWEAAYDDALTSNLGHRMGAGQLWSAPIEVVRPLVWLLSLEDGQDGKAPEARGDRREATSGGRADLTGPERGRYNPRARCEFGDVLPVGDVSLAA